MMLTKVDGHLSLTVLNYMKKQHCPNCRADLKEPGATYEEPGYKRFVYVKCAKCNEVVSRKYVVGKRKGLTYVG